ncbi:MULTISPECIES: hypothetical protein [Yoonia]|jgi:hypothetical protein|uniref:Uncharacterized protein n=1 Tax=Yoonia vestfoldensis SKA53 TaxID=314232 RepID=A3V3V7_9RHOB|nr:hypothetical protein [Yoonia vestfoldensis]EAQ07164.1 hypothetical protein SKA53_02171 [Yoonia vestfoldensis SKA53]
MKPPAKPPVFLERASYRQRRLGDAAQFLPLLGAVLWFIPLLWATDGPEAPSKSSMLTYIFVIWLVLIGLAALLSRLLPDTDEASDDMRR